VLKALDQSGPAYQAGLRVGDATLMLDDVPVRDASDLLRRLGDYPPGATVSLIVRRNGREQTVKATLGTRPRN
jgi:S1-C subfamily serine protease